MSQMRELLSLYCCPTESCHMCGSWDAGRRLGRTASPRGTGTLRIRAFSVPASWRTRQRWKKGGKENVSGSFRRLESKNVKVVQGVRARGHSYVPLRARPAMFSGFRRNRRLSVAPKGGQAGLGFRHLLLCLPCPRLLLGRPSLGSYPTHDPTLPLNKDKEGAVTTRAGHER